MMIEKKYFGTTRNGEEINEYTLFDDDGSFVRLIDYGATVTAISINDRHGDATDIILGFDDLAGYEGSISFLGATCGRYGNRIGNSTFVLNDRRYNLYSNNGPHSLHGGKEGFNRKKWDSHILGNSVVMKYISQDMEEGYPGELTTEAVFHFEDKKFRITYIMQSDADTICNIMNHTYFNLNGHGSGDVLGHSVKINADEVCLNDEYGLACGKSEKVEGTPFDFRSWHVVGERINDHENLVLVRGYDHNYRINASKDGYVSSVRADSGITMNVFSNLPGLQFYGGNNLVLEIGKGGAIYKQYSGLCFETQQFPNAINESSYPSPILKKGEKKEIYTEYQFVAE